MNVQRPNEPRHAYPQLAPVWPASHAPALDERIRRTYQGRSPGHTPAARRRSHIRVGIAPHLGQCSVAARDACGGPAVSRTRSAQRVAFANQNFCRNGVARASPPRIGRRSQAATRLCPVTRPTYSRRSTLPPRPRGRCLAAAPQHAVPARHLHRRALRSAGRSDTHLGEVDEYGDNVQGHYTDRGKETTREAMKKLM